MKRPASQEAPIGTGFGKKASADHGKAPKQGAPIGSQRTVRRQTGEFEGVEIEALKRKIAELGKKRGPFALEQTLLIPDLEKQIEGLREKRREGDLMVAARAQAAPPTVTTVTDAATRRQASRINKTSFSFWLDPEFKRGLFMLKAQDPSRTLEDFCAEAFNDLFSKHGMPTVPATPEPQAQKPRGPKRSPG